MLVGSLEANLNVLGDTVVNKKTIGSWLIHHTGKLQAVTTQRGYEKTYLSGKSGVLLSAISADQALVVSPERLNALASAANINTYTELPALLKILQENEYVDVTPNGVAVMAVTSASVLQNTCDIFAKLEPEKNELAAIELAELASKSPVDSAEALEELSDRHELTLQDAEQLLFDAHQIGFVDAEIYDDGSSILFNGNLFRRDTTKKIKFVLDSLNQQEQVALNEFTAMLRVKACVEVQLAQKILGLPLFDKASSIGLFDISVVSNNVNNTGFVTLPSAFSKFGSSSMVDDAFDLAKAFLSSITYGVTKSHDARGRIKMVEVLLSALIRGESVGPVPAIEQDYRILEMKGVVSVFQGEKKGRKGPMLSLLKREIGELALQAIKQGDVSEHALPLLAGTAITRFTGPEENRHRARRNQIVNSPKSTNDMLSALRTGRI